MNDIRTQITNLDIDEATKKLIVEKVGAETDPRKIVPIIEAVLDAAEAELTQKDAKLDKDLVAADLLCNAEEDDAEQKFDSAIAKLEKEAADLYVASSRDMDTLYAEDLKTGLSR